VVAGGCRCARTLWTDSTGCPLHSKTTRDGVTTAPKSETPDGDPAPADIAQHLRLHYTPDGDPGKVSDRTPPEALQCAWCHSTHVVFRLCTDKGLEPICEKCDAIARRGGIKSLTRFPAPAEGSEGKTPFEKWVIGAAVNVRRIQDARHGWNAALAAVEEAVKMGECENSHAVLAELRRLRSES